jgi:hypothetical protein
MISTGGSGERLKALRVGVVDGAIIGGGTFIGGGSGLHKLVDLTELGIEYPMTGLFTTRKYAGANRDAALAFIRGYLRGVKFFQERKNEAIAITSSNLRSTNSELIERQWQYAKSYMFEKFPIPRKKVSRRSSICWRRATPRWRASVLKMSPILVTFASSPTKGFSNSTQARDCSAGRQAER